MAKRTIFVGIAILIVVFSTYLYLRGVEIEKEYNAVIYSFDTDFEQETKIKITGKHYKKPFGNDTIIGELTVDNNLHYDFNLKYIGTKYFYLITDTNEYAQFRSVGTITASKNLDKVWVMLNDLNERYDIEHGYVFGPADSKERANELIKELMKF